GPVARMWQAKLSEQQAEEPVFIETERPDEAEIIRYLDQQQGSEDLVPAVVVQVNQQSALVMMKGGHQQTLAWDGLKWARSYISDERQGVAPKSAAAILQPGMHILVRQQNEQWQLSQIPQASSALVALNPQDGAIKALVGGYSFSQSQFN